MTDVDILWDEILQEDNSAGHWFYRRLGEHSGYGLYACARADARLVGLALELAESEMPNGLSRPRAKGFQLIAEALDGSTTGMVRLRLELTEAKHRQLFSAVANDLVSSLQGISAGNAAARRVTRRLEEWQGFISSFGEEPLSEEAQIGLIGELAFLCDHLIPALGGQAALDAWKGPLGGSQDFQVPGGAVEIKATRVAANTVTISNIEQLEVPEGRTLILVHSRFGLGGDLNLHRQVLLTRSALGKDAEDLMARFDGLLMKAGYVETLRANDQFLAVSKTQERWFQVRPGFPCLTRLNVPAAISGVTYKLQIGACEPFVRGTGFNSSDLIGVEKVHG
jgi:hypothetical protein